MDVTRWAAYSRSPRHAHRPGSGVGASDQETLRHGSPSCITTWRGRSIDPQRYLQVVELADQLAHAMAASLLLDPAQMCVDGVEAHRPRLRIIAERNTRLQRLRQARVCTENSVRVDYVSESPNVSDDDRSVLPLPGPVRLAVQVEEPT
jgi:hypothetical protein